MKGNIDVDKPRAVFNENVGALEKQHAERKQAEETLCTRTRQLEAVRAVSTEIIRELDLVALLQLITRRAAELGGAQSGEVSLWDSEAQVLVPYAWHGLGDWRKQIRLRAGEGVAGTVVARREGLIVNDYRASSYALPQFLEHTPTTAVLGEPLLYHDHLVGVIIIARHNPDQPFTREDQGTLALFAIQAAIVIENARLHSFAAHAAVAVEKARLNETVRRHAAELEGRVRERTAELAAANRQLEKGSRHKSEFLANMSHEIRAPLNSILGFTQLLRDQTKEVLSAKHARYLDHVYKSGQHLLQLITDIVDLAKVEAGKFILQPEPLPVAQALGDILVIARGMANKKAQEIHADIAPELPPLVVDPVRFKQILFNLLSNAVKFTPNAGRITLRARRASAGASETEKRGTGETEIQETMEPSAPIPRFSDSPIPTEPDFLEISVRDTGVGIRAEDMGRLFGEFVQLETTQAQRHEGSGLGLALTKKLVELHGGRIWAVSDGEGKGSTFTVVMPFKGAVGSGQ